MTNAMLQAIETEAIRFKQEACRTAPRIITGHPVAHLPNDQSRVVNFSTITKVVELTDGKKVFLIYRYPMSWIHSLTDNLQRWGSGRPSTKPFSRRRWQNTFVPKSRIQVYPIEVPGVVAMPYVPNYNLHDVLYYGLGNLSDDQVLTALFGLCDQINVMHTNDKSWGELIVHNIILTKPELQPIICDTEVAYWSLVAFERQCLHDWRDFIFSVCGANRATEFETETLAQLLTRRIDDRRVRQLLEAYCRKPRSLGQKIFWQGFAGALSLPSVEVFDKIRQAVASA